MSHLLNELCLPLLIFYAVLHIFTVRKMALSSVADRIFIWATLTFLSTTVTILVLACLTTPQLPWHYD